MDKEDRRELAKAWLRISEIFAAAWVAAPVAAFFLGKEKVGLLAVFVQFFVGLGGILTAMAIARRIMKGK